MTTATEDSANVVAAPSVRWWLLALGVVPFVGTALLTGRLIWEQTVWTWERGPQMVGFSLAHGSYAVLLLAPFLLALWAAVALVLIVVNLFKKRRIDKLTLMALVLALFHSISCRVAFGRGCLSEKWPLHREPRICSYMLRTTRTCARLRQCCRTESPLPQPTTMNGEPHFTLPRLQETCAPFGFLCPMEQT
jgi:hypothetical protein